MQRGDTTPMRRRLRHGRRTARSWTSFHSAHIGQRLTVRYPWHRFHGQSVRVIRCERWASAQLVRVEAPSGEGAVIPSWMLDAAVCAGMELGEPVVSLSGLAELHRLLHDIGAGRNSREATSPFREETDDDCLARSSTTLAPGRTGIRITGASGPEPIGALDRDGTAGQPSDTGSGAHEAGGQR